MSGSFPGDRYRRGSSYSVLRWAAWLPLVFVGAMMFWTVALGLGGLSLIALSALSTGPDAVQIGGPAPTATEPMPGFMGPRIGPAGPADGIVVNIQESTDPDDVNDDNAGSLTPSVFVGD